MMMNKATIVLLACVACAMAQTLDIWGSVDGARRECYDEGEGFWNQQGQGTSCHGYIPDSNTFGEPEHADPGGTFMPGFGFEYDKYQLNEVNGVGWSMHLDYVAEVGATTTDVITHIGGFPNCNATAAGRAATDTAGLFAKAVYERHGAAACGCNDYPIGDHSSDCYPDCGQKFQDQFGDQFSWSNGMQKTFNASVCESDNSDWGQIWLGQNWFSANDEWYYDNRGATAIGAAMNKDAPASRASVEATSDEFNEDYKLESGRGDIYVAVYDYPLQAATNRYRFRFRFNVKGSENSIWTDDNLWDDNYINQMMTIRSKPLDGEPCNNDGPEVEGIDIKCRHFEPQIQARVSLKDAGVTAEIQGVNWLYGDAVNNNPDVSFSPPSHLAPMTDRRSFYTVQQCSQHCEAGQAAQELEIFTEHEGDNHYINIVVPSAPDAGCGGCSGQDLRGVAFRAFDLSFAGAASNVASLLLVAAAAVLALFAM